MPGRFALFIQTTALAAEENMQERRRAAELNQSASSALAVFLRVAGIVSTVTGVPVAAITRRQRGGRPNRHRNNPTTAARLATIYLTVTVCNVRQASLARAIGRHRRRILFDLRHVEDARENPAIDKLFDRMEALL